MQYSSLNQQQEYIEHGIITELSHLLRSQHWAQRLNLFSSKAARSMLLGNVRSRFRGRGMEFEEVRRYQAGDDIRTIDWKVSARVGQTYTKLFCEERERPCHILVDQRSHLFFGSQQQFKSVLAAEIAAALGWAALAGGDRVGGQVIGDYQERDCRARRNKQAVLRFIHDITELNQQLLENTFKADANKEAPISLAQSLEECQRITRPGTAVFIISDFHDVDDAATKALSNLGKHTDITLLQVTDPMEDSLSMRGNIAISDGQHSSNVMMSESLREAYQQQRAAQQDLLKIAASRARALHTIITTADNARDALTTLFARGR